MAVVLVPAPRQRGDRAGRQPRRHPLGRAWSARSILAINFAPVPNEGALVSASASIALAARRRLRASGSDARRIRSTTCTSPGRRDVLGRRRRRHHRVRFADGRDVHRPAVPAERPRLLDVPCRARDPAGRGHDGADRAAIGEARRTRGARFTLLVGYVFCFLGFLTMLLLWKEGISYWKVGLGYALIGIGVGFAGTPASHSLTGRCRCAGGHGVGHCRPATRPRRRDHAVDPRRAADRRLRVGVSQAHRRLAERVAASATAHRPRSRSRSPAPPNLATQYPADANAIVAGAKSRSSTARTGPTPLGSSRS